MRATHHLEATEIVDAFDAFRTEHTDMALGDMETVVGLLGTRPPDAVAAAYAFTDKRDDLAFDPLAQERDGSRPVDADDIVVQFTWIVSVGHPARDFLVGLHEAGVAQSRAERRAAAERKLAEAQAELDALG